MVSNNSVCADSYGDRYSIPIRDYHLCAGTVDGNGGIAGGKGTCVVRAPLDETM